MGHCGSLDDGCEGRRNSIEGTTLDECARSSIVCERNFCLREVNFAVRGNTKRFHWVGNYSIQRHFVTDRLVITISTVALNFDRADRQFTEKVEKLVGINGRETDEEGSVPHLSIVIAVKYGVFGAIFPLRSGARARGSRCCQKVGERMSKPVKARRYFHVTQFTKCQPGNGRPTKICYRKMRVSAHHSLSRSSPINPRMMAQN
jgi:hypothetical protein